MKHLIILILFILHPFFFVQAKLSQAAQDLKTQLDTIQNDTMKVILLSKLAWELRDDPPPSEADSLARLALSLTQLDKHNSNLGKGLARKAVGFFEMRKGEDVKARQLYQGAVDVLIIQNYFEEVAAVYLLLGNLMIKEEAFDEAINYYYTGIRFSDLAKNEEIKAIIFTMVAEVNIKEKEYDTAEKYYLDAIKIQENINAPTRLANSYYKLGSLYGKRKRNKEALAYYDKADSTFRKEQSYKSLAIVLAGKGNIYTQKKEFKLAEKCYKESLDLKIELKDTVGIAFTNYQIGNVLYRKKEFDAAKEYIISCLKRIVAEDNLELASAGYIRLSKINEHLGELEEALANYKKHVKLKEALLDGKTKIKIKEVKEKYENEKLLRINEKQIANAKEEKIIKNSIIGVLMLILIIAFLLARYYQQKRKTAIQMASQKEIIHEQEILRVQQSAELRALNASQDGQEKERKRIAEALHNSMGSLLSAIQMHIETISETITFQQGDTQALFNKSMQLIQEAAVTNRGIAHEMMPPILMKFGLAAALDYLAEKIRMPGIEVTTSVYGLEKRLSEQLELTLYRLIDELINNILKHAKASEVNIQLTEHEDGLNVIIEDNGVGFNYNPNNPNYGMGLSNIMSRVNHFKGTFDIDSTEGIGTTIIINIPIEVHR